jgi:acyl dehydratase
MGRYLEDFTPGETIVTHRRTVTEADLVIYAGLTGDNNPVHMDEVAARAGPYGGRILHGPFFIGLAFGLLSGKDIIDGTAIALRSVEWRFSGPVRPGDTVVLHATVTEATPHATRTDRGDVRFELVFRNQDGDEVSAGSANVVVLRRSVG